MADVPKLTKKRELLAPTVPKTIGPLGKVVLFSGTALVGLGVVPTTTASSAVTSGKSAPSGASVRSAAPLVLQAVGGGITVTGHESHSSHSSHASHASHASRAF